MQDDGGLELRFDVFELDERQARLTREGRPLAIPPKAFGVLCALARQPGQLIAKGELLDAVWGHQYVSDSVLKTTISELRAALGDDARQPRFIETASRRGYRFIGAPAAVPVQAATPVAVPSADAQPVLVGRGAAHERLRVMWQSALEGRRQVAWLAGEAGIGKTTLIDHFVAGLGPVLVARGQCVDQYGVGEPYLPVLEALAELCRGDPGLPSLLRAAAPAWLLQMPWLCSEADREVLRRELSGTRPERMLLELGELLDRYTTQRPLLLITEDLHWSDQATVQLLDHVARRRGPARLMWLSSFRLAEVIAEEHPLKSLRHELRLHRLSDEIVLEPFSEQELGDYLARRYAQREMSEDFVRALHGRTDGLPLFVVNVLDELQSGPQPEAQALTPERIASLQVPESLAGVIEKQVERLQPEQRMLLEAASVCGAEFRSSAVADALEREASWVGERCEGLVRRRQWLSAAAVDSAPDGSINPRYAFRHALYRHVFYQRMSSATRTQLHRRVALSLERGGGATAAELASHFELGRDLPSALRHYAAAAERALQHFAPVEAMQLTEHALALLPRCAEGPERHQLEMALLGPRGVAAAQLLGVTAPATLQAFKRVQELGELLPEKTTRALEMGSAWAHMVRGEYAPALALGNRLREQAARRGDRLLHASACNLLGTLVSFQGELLEGRRWLEEGLRAFDELADARGDPAFVVDLGVSLLARLGLVLSHLGLMDQARAYSEASLQRAQSLGRPFERVLALAFGGMLALRLGDAPRAGAMGEALQQTASQHGIVEGEGPARWLRGWTLAQTGEPEEGYALMVEGYGMASQLGRVGAGSAAVLGFAAEAAMLCGRIEDARQRLEQALTITNRVGDRILLPDLHLTEAKLSLSRGEPAKARASIDESLREAQAQQARWAELGARVLACEMDSNAQNLQALAGLLQATTGGRDTALARRAEALLRS